ncbi:MAG: hypothetical protein JWP93_1780 [Polaromonas sp.]|nr:hypothetical protein [Polaromonas sp.]
MPLISSFYGVLIYMYFMDNRQHHMPHIHAMYQGHEAVFAIDSADLLDGKFPVKQTRLVQAWIELRREELIADWSLAIKGEPVERVEPLR